MGIPIASVSPCSILSQRFPQGGVVHLLMLTTDCSGMVVALSHDCKHMQLRRLPASLSGFKSIWSWSILLSYSEDYMINHHEDRLLL